MNSRSHRAKYVVPPEEPKNWWLVYIQFNGQPGRSGPYTRDQAEHRMRATHWRPGSEPRFEQMDLRVKRWNGNTVERKKINRAARATRAKLAVERAKRKTKKSASDAE